MRHLLGRTFIARLFFAVVFLAAGAGIMGGAQALATSPGVIICYANQQLLTGGGTWRGQGGNELYHPDFNQGGDGHGLDTIAQGSNQGAC